MKNKKCSVVANLVSDVDFKKLKAWLSKGTSLELSTRPGNMLIITNDDK